MIDEKSVKRLCNHAKDIEQSGLVCKECAIKMIEKSSEQSGGDETEPIGEFSSLFPDLEGEDLDIHIRIYRKFRGMFKKDNEEKLVEYTRNWVKFRKESQRVGTT